MSFKSFNRKSANGDIVDKVIIELYFVFKFLWNVLIQKFRLNGKGLKKIFLVVVEGLHFRMVSPINYCKTQKLLLFYYFDCLKCPFYFFQNSTYIQKPSIHLLCFINMIIICLLCSYVRFLQRAQNVLFSITNRWKSFIFF